MTQKPFLPQDDEKLSERLRTALDAGDHPTMKWLLDLHGVDPVCPAEIPAEIMEGEHEEADQLPPMPPAQEHMDEARKTVTRQYGDELLDAHAKLMSPDPLSYTGLQDGIPELTGAGLVDWDQKLPPRLSKIPAAGADGKTVGDLIAPLGIGTCRHCGGHLFWQTHKEGWKPKPGQTYYFKRWRRCPDCDAVYMDEESKVQITQTIPIDDKRRAREAVETPGGVADSPSPSPTTGSQKLPKCPICKQQALPMIVVEDHPVLRVVFGAPKVCTLCFGEAMGAAKGMCAAIRKRK